MSIFAATLADGALSLLAQQTESGWFETLVKSRHFDEVVVLAVVYGFIALIVLSGLWYKLRVKEWETALKQTMLDRGMSADEICRVLDAGGGIMGAWCRKSRRERPSQPSQSLS